MRLPFTVEQFFDVFGAYNAVAWPVVAGLWVISVAFALRVFRRRAQPVALSALLAIHWLWSGVVYHAAFFTAINPAAPLFAAAFVLEGMAFVWLGIVRRRLVFEFDYTAMSWAGAAFVAYSLAYPFLVVLLPGHPLPRAPLFAVPCPTTLLTAGLLLIAPGPPAALVIIPVLWSIIGGTAALALGVRPDLMLLPAALLLIVRSSSHRFRAAGSAVQRT